VAGDDRGAVSDIAQVKAGGSGVYASVEYEYGLVEGGADEPAGMNWENRIVFPIASPYHNANFASTLYHLPLSSDMDAGLGLMDIDIDTEEIVLADIRFDVDGDVIMRGSRCTDCIRVLYLTFIL